MGTMDSGREYESLKLEEIEFHIRSRRNKIFLLMEEVRRLKIHQRLKLGELGILGNDKDSDGKENFKSALPFMPPITEATLTNYIAFFIATVTEIILFGG